MEASGENELFPGVPGHADQGAARSFEVDVVAEPGDEGFGVALHAGDGVDAVAGVYED